MSKRRTERGSSSRRPARPGWLLPLVAVVLACVAYANAIDNPFVYDDHDTVIGNRSLADLSNLRFILVYTPFRPAVNASYALDRWVWGYRPLGYHLTNITLHVLVVVLLYAWIRRVLSDAGHTGERALPAFAGAALFAVHPMQSEAVSYVSGRSEVLCAVGFVAALLLARGAILQKSVGRAWLAAACALLAIASKETGLVLPVVFVAYDWLLRPGDDGDRRWRLWRLVMPLMAVFLLAAIYRLLTLGAAVAPGAAARSGLTQAIVICRYVALFAWPSGQSIMHGVHRVTGLTDPLAWCAVGALATACSTAMLVRRSHPAIAFGIVWFLIVIAPSSSVIALREGMAEHRVYLASAGIFIALAAAIQRILTRGSAGSLIARRTVMVGVGAALTVFCVLTALRNRVWADPVQLWTEATAQARGMWEPHYALADSLREAQQCAAAISEYQAVVALEPTHRDAYTNLGICQAQTGRLEDADRSFRRALQIDPAFARGYTNLGALALVAGDATRARDYYREAIAQDPDNVLARMQLASLYENTFHDYHAAARMCGEVRLIAPATPGVVECVERNQRLASGGQ